MGAIKRALEEREDRAREHLRVTTELIDSLRAGLESNKPSLVLMPGDGNNWAAVYNALDDLEQVVCDFYKPMLSWADGDDDPEGGVGSVGESTVSPARKTAATVRAAVVGGCLAWLAVLSLPLLAWVVWP